MGASPLLRAQHVARATGPGAGGCVLARGTCLPPRCQNRNVPGSEADPPAPGPWPLFQEISHDC